MWRDNYMDDGGEMSKFLKCEFCGDSYFYTTQHDCNSYHEQLFNENQKLKKQLEVCREALEDIGRVRYGLSFEASDEEARDYWSDLAIERRDRARQALAELEKMK